MIKNFNIIYNITFKSGHVMNNQIMGVYAPSEDEAKAKYDGRNMFNSVESVEFVSITEMPMTHLDHEFLRGELSTVGD